MNDIKKHKKSNIYSMGQFKYSAVIWTIGAGILSLTMWGAFFGMINRGGFRETFFIFGSFLAYKCFNKAKQWYHYRHASIGAALGLDVDPRFIKTLLKLDTKIKKLEIKKYWLEDYLSKEGLKELKKKRGEKNGNGLI